LDADTQLGPNFVDAALPLFDDPKVVAVAGCVHTDWNPSGVSLFGKLLISHRGRIYAVTQRLIKIGQTWRRSNALYIIPGFASIYRTRVLPHIEINPPGLVIEDFNMTFEIYRRRLGRVDFTLDAWAVTQDPDRFGDYVRQTKRWTLGFWQTVRRYRLQANLFSVMLTLLVVEQVISSMLFVLLPALISLGVLPMLFPDLLGIPRLGEFFSLISTHVDLEIVLVAVLFPDFLLTIAVTIIERRPRYLLFAPAFLALRIIDSVIVLYTLPRAWTERSTGRWVSPTRR
ncbi:MAG: glycosyltransferase family 2 protein, partial [Acidobacteria bacterium]|nr:glycosyltransferase family 2 protein [Acidobacteriota bacterium]